MQEEDQSNEVNEKWRLKFEASHRLEKVNKVFYYYSLSIPFLNLCICF